MRNARDQPSDRLVRHDALVSPSAPGRRKALAGIAGSVALLVAFALAVTWGRARLDPDRLWNEAEAALRAGRTERAAANLFWIHRLRSPTTRDWLLEAQIASARHRTDLALSALSHVPEGDPLDAQAFLMSGRRERERKRLRAAEGHLQHAVKANSGLIEAHKELIYIYGIQGRRREVDAEFRSLSRLTSLNHHDLFTWALTHFTSWSPDVAADLSEFIKADADDRQSRLALAEHLLDQPGQADNVIRILGVLPETDPDAMALRVGLAIHQGRLDEAQAMLANAPRDHAGLGRFRARLAMKRGDVACAVGYFRVALSAEPYDRVSTFELGQALSLSGDREAAAGFLNKATRLNELYDLIIRVRSPDKENQPLDLTKLAGAFEAAGLSEEAWHWYALAISRDPLDPKAQQGLHRVASWR